MPDRSAHHALRVAVIGAGAFGRNHLRVYRELESTHPGLVELATLIEPDPSRRSESASLYNIPAFASLDEALNAGPSFDAASICVPTIHHAAIAEQLLAAGIDILIEKPFAASLAEADRILSLAERHHRIVQIGHLERFNPAVTAAAQRITRPMFFEAHRLSIFTPRSLDVDVVLDLMIHDLDIVLSLTQSRVKEVRAVGLPVLSPKVDIANVRVEFDSGCVANFTASRVSTEQVRKLRLFQPHEYLSLDFARQELLTIKVDPTLIAQLAAPNAQPPALKPASQPPTKSNATNLTGTNPPPTESNPPALTGTNPPPTESNPPALTGTSHQPTESSPTILTGTGQPPEGSNPPALKGTGFSPSVTPAQFPAALAAEGISHPSRGLSLEKFAPPHAEPLRLELEDFLSSVRNRTQPRVTGASGRAALALALEINQQIAGHAHRAGLT